MPLHYLPWTPFFSRSNGASTGTLPVRSQAPTLAWRSPIVDSVNELENIMHLVSGGRPVKLFGGDKVRKNSIPTGAHWVCARDWERFKEYALVEKCPTSGEFGMRAFYRFVLNPANHACGFTLVAQLMDRVQEERLSWRLRPLASLLSEMEGGGVYEGTKAHRDSMAKALPKASKSAQKSGSAVCCPTIFRPHASCCAPYQRTSAVSTATDAPSTVTAPWTATPSPSATEAATDSAALSSACEEESITSAAGLQRGQNKKQFSHAPSARCVGSDVTWCDVLCCAVLLYAVLWWGVIWCSVGVVCV